MIKKIYGTISKTEELDDGTIKVYGYASSGSEDSDGEFISPEAMKEALPDYMKFGAVREMHGDSAAGTALEAQVLEDGKTWFGAHVVDPIAVLKVKTGTYKGFSIGGKVVERDNLNKNLIKKIKLVEVSLVDRPANPEAVFTMFKAEDLKESKKLDKDNKNLYNKGKFNMKQEEIKKGLGNVQWIAQLVSELDFLYQNLQAEKDIEGDDSEIPEDLKNVITSLSTILVQSAQEETSELESQENQEQEVEVVEVEDEDDEDDEDDEENNQAVEMSNKIKNLKKSGARNSQKDQETLNQILALLKELGADESNEEDDDNKDDKKDGKDDKEKEENKKSSKIENLEKMNQEQSAFISDLNKSIKTIMKEKQDLEKRVSELEKEPNFEKRAHLTSLSKSEDYNEVNKDEDYIVKNSKGEIDEVATAIKKAQRNGKRII